MPRAGELKTLGGEVKTLDGEEMPLEVEGQGLWAFLILGTLILRSRLFLFLLRTQHQLRSLGRLKGKHTAFDMMCSLLNDLEVKDSLLLELSFPWLSRNNSLLSLTVPREVTCTADDLFISLDSHLGSLIF